MSANIKCFWIEPTKQVNRYLRRFCWSSKEKCASKFGYHNAAVFIGEFPGQYTAEGYLESFEAPSHDDPRWPKQCEACGYQFAEDDQWQPSVKEIYVRQDTQERFELENAPAGAMWDSWWHSEKKYPDGINLTVKLPDGCPWVVDHAYDHEGWTRTGTIPNVTARPSILTPNYHGFLTDGYLVSV